MNASIMESLAISEGGPRRDPEDFAEDTVGHTDPNLLGQCEAGMHRPAE